MLTFLYDTEKRKPKETSKQKEQYAMFKCDCGKETEIYKRHGMSGSVKRCKECGIIERTKHSFKHGLSRTKEYTALKSMIQRCENPSNPEYKNYGARGISVCSEWKNSPEEFMSYLKKLTNYNIDGYTIDRIDVNGNYEVGNIRYASKITQSNNKRFNIPANEFYGVRKVRNAYIAEISHNGKYRYLGSSKIARECALIREKHIEENSLQNKSNKELLYV